MKLKKKLLAWVTNGGGTDGGGSGMKFFKTILFHFRRGSMLK